MATQSNMTVNLGKLEGLRTDLARKFVARVGILNNNPTVSSPGQSIGMAELGAIHEFGAPGANIPPRSFLRFPIAFKRKEIIETVGKSQTVKKDVEAGNIKGVLEAVGAVGVAMVLGAFASGGYGQWPALKPQTIKRKGSDAILIDSGALQKSITFDVVKAS